MNFRRIERVCRNLKNRFFSSFVVFTLSISLMAVHIVQFYRIKEQIKNAIMSGKPIFLIGFMGAGKSRTGKRLAKALDLPFLDSDLEIMKNTQRSIEHIFAEEGEAYFRTLEKEWLLGLGSNSTIVSVGGGFPCFHSNMERMNQMGLTIYLKLSVEALAERLQQSKTVRPLIEPYKQDEIALKSFIRAKLDEREVFYNQSHLTLNGLSLSQSRLNELMVEIKERL